MDISSAQWKLPPKKLISREEVERLLAVARRDGRRDDYEFFVVAANTALRVSEVVHLSCSDVGDGYLSIVRRKKRKLQREALPVADEVFSILSARKRERKNGWLWPGDSGPCKIRRKSGGRVVSEETICKGGHVSIRTIQRLWTLYCRAAGVLKEGRGIHSMRHYAITEFYRTHRDLRATQEFAGHSSGTMTSIYAHVVDLAEKVRKVKPVL